MAIASISLEYDGDPAPYYCPVCGRPVFAAEEFDSLCEHVIFSGCTDWGEWNNPVQEAAFKKAVTENFSRIDDDDQYESAEEYLSTYPEDAAANPSLLIEYLDSPSAFLVEITTNGPCATSGTMVVVVDYKPARTEK